MFTAAAVADWRANLQNDHNNVSDYMFFLGPNSSSNFMLYARRVHRTITRFSYGGTTENLRSIFVLSLCRTKLKYWNVLLGQTQCNHRKWPIIGNLVNCWYAVGAAITGNEPFYSLIDLNEEKNQGISHTSIRQHKLLDYRSEWLLFR